MVGDNSSSMTCNLPSLRPSLTSRWKRATFSLPSLVPASFCGVYRILSLVFELGARVVSESALTLPVVLVPLELHAAARTAATAASATTECLRSAISSAPVHLGQIGHSAAVYVQHIDADDQMGEPLLRSAVGGISTQSDNATWNVRFLAGGQNLLHTGLDFGIVSLS